MYLSALNKNKPDTVSDPDITGLTQDSRQVRAGYLFAAISGTSPHEWNAGPDYVRDAVKNGAAAILLPSEMPAPDGVGNVPVIRSDNPRRDIARMASVFYPEQPDNIIAVTGTNGKTSTVHFAQQMWVQRGYQSASLGTLGVRASTGDIPGSMTTPDPVSLHKTISGLAHAGITHLAMEASSHGLKQHRMDYVRVKAAGFTNLTRDHLDYHKTMEEYLSAKSRLFTDILAADGVAVLNADVPEFFALKDSCAAQGRRIFAYGTHGHELKLLKRVALPDRQILHLDILGRRHEAEIPLVGSFQAMNALCSLGLAMAVDSGLDPVEALSSLTGVPGRLQAVPGHPRGAAVYVDYAHTPDALTNILLALRPHTQGRLVCLFGCGGDRDPGKRPMMGKIAAAEADLVVITDDNPRSENPDAIRRAIAEGAGPQAKIIDGRRAAIAWAVEQLKEGDVLVLAGKGHEQGQIFADHVDPFDDVEEAMNAIQKVAG